MEGCRGRLVLVDDDLAVQRLLAQALRLDGFDVEVAGDAEEGWQLIERFRPDLVVLDVMMPGVDGLSLLRRLRESPTHRDLYVMLLSARAQPEDLQRGTRAGADVYITKPFSIEQLVWHLDEALAGHAALRSADRPDPLARMRRNGPLSMDDLLSRQPFDHPPAPASQVH